MRITQSRRGGARARRAFTLRLPIGLADRLERESLLQDIAANTIVCGILQAFWSRQDELTNKFSRREVSPFAW